MNAVKDEESLSTIDDVVKKRRDHNTEAGVIEQCEAVSNTILIDDEIVKGGEIPTEEVADRVNTEVNMYNFSSS